MTYKPSAFSRRQPSAFEIIGGRSSSLGLGAECDGREAAKVRHAIPALLLMALATAALLTAPLIWGAPHCRPVVSHQQYLEPTAEQCARILGHDKTSTNGNR